LIADLVNSAACQTRFGVIHDHQEQIREGSKAQSGQYLAGCARL